MNTTRRKSFNNDNDMINDSDSSKLNLNAFSSLTTSQLAVVMDTDVTRLVPI